VTGDYRDPQIPDLREGNIRFRPQDEKFIADLYLGETAYLDQQIGRLLEALRKLGRQGRPVILVFTADHGEELWDHGDWGHGNSLHQELLHVPLFIQAPGVEPRVITNTVSHLALVPTLRELTGLPPDPGAEARSLLSGATNDAPCFSSQNVYYHPLTALRQGPHKIIHNLAHDSFLYYNLADDPREINPQDPAAVADAQPLIDQLRQHEADMAAKALHNTSSRDLDAAANRRLKAVGYIQ
jgi:arylsulfatase A-like enzyme